MSIQFKFPPENETYDKSSAVNMAMLIFLTAGFLPLLEIRFTNICQSSFPLSTHNVTVDSNLSGCSIPYDQCRCSVLSNRSGFTKECIPDVEAMAGHIVPLVIYAQVLYLFYKLVSFTGKYRHIFTDIFWIIALVIFVILAIAVHGSSCFHYNTVLIMSATGGSLAMVPFCLYAHIRDQYLLRAGRDTNPDQRLTTNNHEHDITITFTLF
jgi:hypothetical protein